MADAQSQNANDTTYRFILFIVEGGSNSDRALNNLRELCEQWLPDRHTIEVVDVVKDFQTALEYNILLTPSVVLVDPKPQTVIYGDLSNADKFLEALNLK